MENQKLLTKLPDWLVSRWNREATGRMKDEKKYPDFKNFATFISAEADLLCNLISSCYAEREVERATDSTHQESKPKCDKSLHQDDGRKLKGAKENLRPRQVLAGGNNEPLILDVVSLVEVM